MIPSDGWTISEFGYMCLRRTDKFGRTYILPGLYLVDGPRPTKIFHGYKPEYKKDQIEVYLKNHFENSIMQRSQAEQEMTTLVHDLRHLSTAIYHSAEQAIQAVESKNYSEQIEGLITIINTHKMLKSRIDYVDYGNGVERFEDVEIPVFECVKEVVRCFKATAEVENMELQLSGTSDRIAKGPNFLHLIPYTLIDNAIKYSTKSKKVRIRVKDVDNKTIIIIASSGLVIEESETKRVFKRGFRGQYASTLLPTGTGLGLSHAKEIVDKFSGKISVRCVGQLRDLDGIKYRDNIFRVWVPTEPAGSEG